MADGKRTHGFRMTRSQRRASRIRCVTSVRLSGHVVTSKVQRRKPSSTPTRMIIDHRSSAQRPAATAGHRELFRIGHALVRCLLMAFSPRKSCLVEVLLFIHGCLNIVILFLTSFLQCHTVTAISTSRGFLRRGTLALTSWTTVFTAPVRVDSV